MSIQIYIINIQMNNLVETTLCLIINSYIINIIIKSLLANDIGKG